VEGEGERVCALGGVGRGEMRVGRVHVQFTGVQAKVRFDDVVV
jgi:hypothetical protein